MQHEPMGHVAKAIELMSGGRFRLNNFLRRSKSTPPPSRTSIFDQQPDSDLTKVFSGVDEIILSGVPRKISRFAGNSNFIERLDEYGLGRNRTISEDYGTLTWQNPPPPGSVVVLLDDSVGQGTSLFAATLAVHQAVPAAHVSPLTYWAFANAPLHPKMSLTSSNRVGDVIQADAEQLANAVNSHYDMARDFVHKAEIYAKQAERVMRDDPVGNWLGGLLRGQSDYDQYKARQFLMRFLLDLRQREIAVKIAASNVDSSNKAFHQRLLYELTHDPAGYRQ
ncbi:hypothetical protein [Cyanobium sp. Copco_Reservoir_LC18]|uniref:hypothetical protein n=1 Tax=Cyanobium sp. Copco_Reservoir_LC18 TaxID=1328305 RepID=UPI0013573D81|nr:hypothetical protein [Cyanobium sp. Copco_Reservoir_LC18]